MFTLNPLGFSVSSLHFSNKNGCIRLVDTPFSYRKRLKEPHIFVRGRGEGGGLYGHGTHVTRGPGIMGAGADANESIGFCM